jgi:DTW domain-containing protein
MSRRDNAKVRCAHCHLHVSLCLCDQLVRLSTRTRLILVIHRVEQRKPTNTGLLAAHCLQNSEVWLRGCADQTANCGTPDPRTLPLYLYPGEGAVPITEFANAPQPVTLYVPDGNWRQAAKVRRRVPDLAQVKMVSLPQGPASEYRLRHEEREGGLATMEAIARALGVLEGQAIQVALERVFRIMVGRTLWSRGAIPAAEVIGGIPEGALRHDPLSRARRSLQDIGGTSG